MSCGLNNVIFTTHDWEWYPYHLFIMISGMLYYCFTHMNGTCDTFTQDNGNVTENLWKMLGDDGNVWEIYMGSQLDDLPVESYNIDPAK